MWVRTRGRTLQRPNASGLCNEGFLQRAEGRKGVVLRCYERLGYRHFRLADTGRKHSLCHSKAAKLNTTRGIRHFDILRFVFAKHQNLLGSSRANSNACVSIVVATHIFFLSCVSYDFPTVDEVAHLAAGVSHWEFERFDLYQVNPPLIRSIVTFPAWCAGAELDWSLYTATIGTRSEFTIGQHNLHERKLGLVNEYFYPRILASVFSIIGIVYFFHFARPIGNLAALLACFGWCVSSELLAHAMKIGPDVGALFFGLLAAGTAHKYLQVASIELAGWAGVTLGLAMLSKLTWLTAAVVLPATVATCLICMRASFPKKSAKRRFADLFVFWGAALVTLNSGYLFEESFNSLRDFRFCSQMLGGEGCNAYIHGNRFKHSWLEKIPVPVPRNYLLGIDYLKYEVEEKKWSFLLGEWKYGSWPYYYVLTTLFKTPEMMLLAALIGLGVLVMGVQRKLVKPEVVSMFLFLGVPSGFCFVSVSLQGGFNHHHRYVLMVYPFIFALAAYVASPVGVKLLRVRLPFLGPEKRSIAIPLAITLAALSAVSSLRVHPHYTSYFNTLSGGPENGWRLLGFSNIDWGQDILEVDKWLKENPDKQPLVMDLDYFGMNGDLFDVPTSNPPQLPSDASILEVQQSITETQWWIISVKKLYNRPGHDGIQYLQQLEPVDRIAYAYHVYRIDPLPVAKSELSQGASP